MTWHYRTIETVYGEDDVELSVHEFYRNDKGEYTNWSKDPVSPGSRQECLWMLEAFSKPPAMRRRADTGTITPLATFEPEVTFS